MPTFEEWLYSLPVEEHRRLRGEHPATMARAAWDAAVERCAVVAETRFRPADAWSQPTVFGGDGVVASAVYYRDAELHDAGRQIAAAIRAAPPSS